MANYVFLFLGNLGTAKVKESSQQVSSISSDLILPSRRRPPRPLVSDKLSSSSNIVLAGREKEHEDVDIPLAYQTGAPKTCMNSFVLFCCFFLFCSLLFCFVFSVYPYISLHLMIPLFLFWLFTVEKTSKSVLSGLKTRVISYPDLLLTKPKARSGQIRFVHVIACQECSRR